MRVPDSMEGVVFAGGLAPEQALRLLEAALLREKATSVRREDDTIVFRVAMLRGTSNWNVLTPVTEGTLGVSRDAGGARVAYRFGFRRMLVISTIQASVAGVLILAMGSGGPVARMVMATIGFAFLWSCLYLGNYWIARERLARFVDRALTVPAPGSRSTAQAT